MKLPDTQIYSNDPKFTDDTYVEKVHLCILFELLLRHFGNGTTKQKWFFSPEEAIEMDLFRLVITHRLINDQLVFEIK